MYQQQRPILSLDVKGHTFSDFLAAPWRRTAQGSRTTLGLAGGLCGTQNLAKSKQRRQTVPDLTIPTVMVFLLFFVTLVLYKLGLAMVAVWGILRGKR
jgi:hypothetical protein